MGNMLPKGSTFRWSSNTFYTTADALLSGSATITADLEARGLAVAGAGSGGGAWIPSATHYGANVRLLRPMGDDEARQMVEDAFGNTFTFLGAVTATWEAVSAGVSYVTSTTVADIKTDTKEAAKAALPLASVLTVAILAVAAIVIASKVRT